MLNTLTRLVKKLRLVGLVIDLAQQLSLAKIPSAFEINQLG
jgi:uncharacterized protein (UPF0128 family)